MINLKIKDIINLLLYSIPNTILSFGIVYIINNVLEGKKEFLNDYMWIVFLSFIAYTYLLNIIFQKGLNKYSFKLLYENEKKIFRQILKAPLIKLEQHGAQRFYTAVEDLRTFSLLPYTVTHTINSLLMLILCLGYMFTLSLVSAIIVLILIILVAASYFIVMNSMSKKVNVLRDYNDDYYEYVDDVVRGFKELKLSLVRRNNLFGKFLVPNRDNARDLDYKINFVFQSINLISQYGLYFVIGVILFVLPNLGLLDRGQVISYVVIILFISGPINNLINLQQMYTRFFVANKRLNAFLNDFEIPDEKEIDLQDKSTEDFENLIIKDVSFNYNNENSTEQFSLGPINLEIKKGETIFIVGGNGSGKSTFINVFTGLYDQTEGEILLNNKDISNNKQQLQDMMTAVFTDNHLFAFNYDNYELENNPRYKELLKIMQLDNVVIDDKDQSARRTFSKGQSKRMSMIFAILQNKPVLVLDEWAADQDPHFRKYFYEFLLPKLKEEGKTIVAVTHDDSYFKYADRIIKFDYGQIVKDIVVQNNDLNLETLWYNIE